MKKLNCLSREERAKLNILSSFATQIVAVICAFIIPKLIISFYGSEQYGAVSSITQFLGYITLLEGGICGVARSALYRTLVDENDIGTSKIVREIDLFFKRISLVFIAYVIILSFTFKYISKAGSLDYVSSIFLVLAISISTIAQYLFGIKYVVFLQAAQKAYIINIITIIATIGNTILTVILVFCGYGLVVVKFASSLVFLSRPLLLSIYVKQNYRFVKTTEKTNALSQKWEALGQHLAYFIHSNTDILVLTIFTNLNNVAIYSVYNMIVIALQNLIYGFSNGMEPLFGELLAQKEHKELDRKVSYYETLISIIATILFLTTAVLIVPFVGIYTKGLEDANYYQPFFSFILVLTALIFCIRLPYHALIIASGRFKETRLGAYGEAIINLALSIILVPKWGLIGVTIGTVIGCFFRFVYYIVYLSKHILKRNVTICLKRISYSLLPLLGVFTIEQLIVLKCSITTYLDWSLTAIIVFMVNCVIIVAINYLGYKREVKHIIKGLFSNIVRR